MNSSSIIALVGVSLLANLNCSPAPPVNPPKNINVDVRKTLNTLIDDEDTDGDKRITINDPRVEGTNKGDRRFWIVAQDGSALEVVGTYYLANLLQELRLAEEAGQETCSLDPAKIFELPSHRISRMINAVYWDGLTRRIDTTGLSRILFDQKISTTDDIKYLYVPDGDSGVFDHFSSFAESHPAERIKVARLSRELTPEYSRSLENRAGLLMLATKISESGSFTGVPYVVPGGRFNEMYGWDSYFIILGLLKDQKVSLAKGMVENAVYEVKNYGKILNANRTYYLTRSQPPFLTSMALEVYAHMPGGKMSKEWLRNALEAAIQEYWNVWMNSDHLTACGLSRYFDSGSGPAPEVEPGHYDAVYERFAQTHNMERKTYESAYKSGRIKDPGLDDYFVHDRAMRESGHDTSYRLEGRCADLVTVDLNSLLYKIERDLAETIQREFSGLMVTNSGKSERSVDWLERLNRRKELVDQLLWDEQQGMFFDYDFVRRERTSYESATTFYPLWSDLASQHQANAVVQNALRSLEMPGGIAASSEKSRGPLDSGRKPRQWDYPFGWAPHQMIVWKGLTNYGFDAAAERLAYRWLFTITSNAVNFDGMMTEKLDVVNRTHEAFVEYGNVGTTFSYITREGFGWTNASYQVGLDMLSPDLRKDLDALLPPEWIFGK